MVTAPEVCPQCRKLTGVHTHILVVVLVKLPKDVHHTVQVSLVLRLVPELCHHLPHLLLLQHPVAVEIKPPEGLRQLPQFPHLIPHLLHLLHLLLRGLSRCRWRRLGSVRLRLGLCRQLAAEMLPERAELLELDDVVAAAVEVAEDLHRLPDVAVLRLVPHLGHHLRHLVLGQHTIAVEIVTLEQRPERVSPALSVSLRFELRPRAAAEVIVQQLKLLEADHTVAISIESRCRTP